jgi:DNA adenine methylase
MKFIQKFFLGGGAVFWAKKRVKNETINDKLDIVINFYKVLKTKFSALKKLINATCFSRTMHHKALLIWHHRIYFSDVEVAWAFWMLANFSHGQKLGGGLKFSNDQSILPPVVMKNKKAEFTEQLVKRIENTIIENKDAIAVIESRNVAKSFHYLDPPYPNADQGHYRGYTFNDLEKLLVKCEQIKGKFLLSNYNSEMLDSYIIKNNWWKKEFQVNNKGMRKNDKNKVEVLVANYVPAGKQTFDF